MANTFRYHQLTTGPAVPKLPMNIEGVPTGELWVQAVDGAAPWVGTAALEISLDGENWFVSTVSPIAADEYKAIPELVRFVRINVSAYTSGQLDVTFAGFSP